MMTRSLLLLPGDGVGPEVVREVRRVAAALPLDVAIDEAAIGGASLDCYGVPIRDEVIARAKESSAVLVGAVGGPKWRNVPRDLRPEAGLLRLRFELDAYANLRPAAFHAALEDASPLQSQRIAHLDLMIVRELTSGIYFGEPRGITRLGGDDSFAVDTQRYTVGEIRRVARKAFEIARTRRGHVTSADKANVMETGVLWRETVQSLHDEEFPDVTLEHLYADACGLRIVTSPASFDIIVTDNLFGDILSDVAAGLVASIGMLPSASLGADGGPGLYEPIHGSAPDIAGQGIANPIGAILSLAMALEFSLNDTRSAEVIRKAVGNTLDQGIRTSDIGGSASTEQIGTVIAAMVSSMAKDDVAFS